MKRKVSHRQTFGGNVGAVLVSSLAAGLRHELRITREDVERVRRDGVVYAAVDPATVSPPRDLMIATVLALYDLEAELAEGGTIELRLTVRR